MNHNLGIHIEKYNTYFYGDKFSMKMSNAKRKNNLVIDLKFSGSKYKKEYKKRYKTYYYYSYDQCGDKYDTYVDKYNEHKTSNKTTYLSSFGDSHYFFSEFCESLARHYLNVIYDDDTYSRGTECDSSQSDSD